MSKLTDAELYLRGAETLLASWEQYARGRGRRDVAALGGRCRRGVSQ